MRLRSNNASDLTHSKRIADHSTTRAPMTLHSAGHRRRLLRVLMGLKLREKVVVLKCPRGHPASESSDFYTRVSLKGPHTVDLTRFSYNRRAYDTRLSNSTHSRCSECRRASDIHGLQISKSASPFRIRQRSSLPSGCISLIEASVKNSSAARHFLVARMIGRLRPNLGVARYAVW